MPTISERLAVPKVRATLAVAAVAIAGLAALGWQASLRSGNEADGRPGHASGAGYPAPGSAALAKERDELVVTASRLMPLDPARAEQVNAAIPVKEPGPGARPFFSGRGESAEAALACLARAVYYEAASEPIAGQRAVAQVVLNRSRHPAYPNSVCAVVYQGSERRTGCQFTFTCDGSLHRRPLSTLYARAEQVAREALAGHVERNVGWATHYHADYVVPYWASKLDKVAVLGRHIFYRWSGGWSNPGVFRRPYSGVEIDPARTLAATLVPDTPVVEGPAGGDVLEDRPVQLRTVEPATLADERSGRLAVDEPSGQLKPELATAPKLRVDEQTSGLLAP